MMQVYTYRCHTFSQHALLLLWNRLLPGRLSSGWDLQPGKLDFGMHASWVHSNLQLGGVQSNLQFQLACMLLFYC